MSSKCTLYCACNLTVADFYLSDRFDHFQFEDGMTEVFLQQLSLFCDDGRIYNFDTCQVVKPPVATARVA